ncbi:hypothetical protein [Pontibacillus yanchengensis]|uniref:DUF4025 domain-containing protein n=1 Tax=Pontibacillus yanchengensis Y32 TaxID=1385514 RepID=A0A0A2TC63_9BACI|nr:hypothetical protein [Pontibacillus yanchengensis]KGP73382.1 hypothetical protein N782_05635 [Pontibacillus yanchengensis Y32]
MKKIKINRESNNKLAGAFNANMKISKAFNEQDKEDGVTEGELLSSYYMKEDIDDVNYSTQRNGKSVDDQVRNHE